ncbi:hypothetical protein IJI02_00300 [Candidatus Saccharibacteria bacterium]|nr:hypothetical protein [Candidatus Saccharibacteria bacterium]
MTQTKPIDFFRPDWTDSPSARSSQASLKKKPLSSAHNVVKNTTSSPVNPPKPAILERNVPRGAHTAELKSRRGPAIVTHYPPKAPISSQIPLTSPATTPRRPTSVSKPSASKSAVPKSPTQSSVPKLASKPTLRSAKEAPFVAHPSSSRVAKTTPKPAASSTPARTKSATKPRSPKPASSTPFLASVKVDKVPLSAGPASSSDYAAELSTEATIEPPAPKLIKKPELPKLRELAKKSEPKKSESRRQPDFADQLDKKLSSSEADDPRRSRRPDPVRPRIKKPRVHIPAPVIIAVAILLGILTGIGVFALIS